MSASFTKMASTLAAVRCLNAGQSFAQVASSAKRHPSTIKRWLKNAGFFKWEGKYRVR
jgi:transposase